MMLLAVLSSLLGLVRPGHYNDAEALVARYFVQDVIMLAVAVPVLAAGLWLTVRGSVRGRFLWLGSLAFMTYMWTTYSLQVAFNEFFLGYVALFALSLFTLIGALLDTDAEAVREALHGRVSRRMYTAVLGLTAAGLASLWLSEIIPAALSGSIPPIVRQFGHQGIETYVIDLGVVVPALSLAAVWLWRGRAWGYVMTGVLLVFAAVLAPNLTAITVVDMGAGVEMSMAMVLGTVLPPAIGLLFAVKYLLAIDGKEDRSNPNVAVQTG